MNGKCYGGPYRPVKATSNITFDERDKTFRLYSGKSIYSFCISPELTLEHLHWGEAVPPGYDLRYLCQSSRQTHFSTVEAAPDKLGGKIVLAAETLEEVQKTWRENKTWGLRDVNDIEQFQKKRLENYSWRIMSKISQDAMRKREKLEAQENSLTAKLGSFSLAGVSRNSSVPNIKTLFPGVSVNKDSDMLSSNTIGGFDGFSNATKAGGSSSSLLPIEDSYGFDDIPDISHGNPSISALPAFVGSSLHSSYPGGNLFGTRFQRADFKGGIGVDGTSDKSMGTVGENIPNPYDGLLGLKKGTENEGKKMRYIPSEANLLSMKQMTKKAEYNTATIYPKHRILETLHYNNKRNAMKRHTYRQTFDRAIGKIGKGGICVEYADYGTGDFRSPSFQVIDNFNGSSISPLRYRRHRIYKGKLPCTHGTGSPSSSDNALIARTEFMPGVKCYDENEASTLIVTMADVISGLDVDLVYGKWVSLNYLQDRFLICLK
jgi:hypothetical protein